MNTGMNEKEYEKLTDMAIEVCVLTALGWEIDNICTGQWNFRHPDRASPSFTGFGNSSEEALEYCFNSGWHNAYCCDTDKAITLSIPEKYKWYIQYEPNSGESTMVVLYKKHIHNALKEEISMPVSSYLSSKSIPLARAICIAWLLWKNKL